MIVDAAHETVAEKRALKARHVQVMLDVPSGFLQVERRNLIADGDALVERLVGGEAELMGQLGLTEQDEGDERSGIHLLIEQETKLIEDLGGGADGPRR